MADQEKWVAVVGGYRDFRNEYFRDLEERGYEIFVARPSTVMVKTQHGEFEWHQVVSRIQHLRGRKWDEIVYLPRARETTEDYKMIRDMHRSFLKRTD